MKFLKLSLAASVALGALSTASFAQPLEEAIKGVDVSGYLRYRYTDDRQNYDPNRGQARHEWKAEADFKTPVVNNVALNLGVLYANNQNVNHGKGGATVGGVPRVWASEGLGSSADGNFGVSQFYAAITPDSTATTVLVGKQKLNTPLTMASDGDRGTGVLALNSDLPGLTLAGGAFDSWSLDDLGDATVSKPLYTLAAIYSLDTDIGNFGAQAWGFYVDDVTDFSGFLELSYKQSLFNAKLQYLFAKLVNDGDKSIPAELFGVGNPNPNNLKWDLAETNDLLSLQVGADFRQDFGVPFDVTLGYITNFQDGTAVSFDNEGAIAKAGKIWWQDGIVSFGYNNDSSAFGQEVSLNTFYLAGSYGLLEDRLKLGLEGVVGEVKTDNAQTGREISKVDFYEITPTISWQHSKALKVSGYYAILVEDFNVDGEDDRNRNRARVEVKYSF